MKVLDHDVTMNLTFLNPTPNYILNSTTSSFFAHHFPLLSLSATGKSADGESFMSEMLEIIEIT